MSDEDRDGEFCRHGQADRNPADVSHTERVAALVFLSAEGSSVRGTARKLGIPETTLRRWANGRRSPEARAAAPSHRGLFAAVFERAE